MKMDFREVACWHMYERTTEEHREKSRAVESRERNTGMNQARWKSCCCAAVVNNAIPPAT